MRIVAAAIFASAMALNVAVPCALSMEVTQAKLGLELLNAAQQKALTAQDHLLGIFRGAARRTVVWLDVERRRVGWPPPLA